MRGVADPWWFRESGVQVRFDEICGVKSMLHDNIPGGLPCRVALRRSTGRDETSLLCRRARAVRARKLSLHITGQTLSSDPVSSHQLHSFTTRSLRYVIMLYLHLIPIYRIHQHAMQSPACSATEKGHTGLHDACAERPEMPSVETCQISR